MGDYKLPADFKVEYSLDYEMYNNKFSVGVQYRGMDDAVTHSWMYVIAVNKNIVAAGPYEWATHDGFRLSNRAICHHLASFWGHSAAVTQAKNVPEEEPSELDALVFKCSEWMHQHLQAPAHFSDYDIVHKFMDKDEWLVILRPNYMPQYMLEFCQDSNVNYVNVQIYETELGLKTIL